QDPAAQGRRAKHRGHLETHRRLARLLHPSRMRQLPHKLRLCFSLNGSRSKHGGRRREVNVREVLNAIFYVLSTGCQWQALPKDLPPKSTAHSYFMLWDWDGTLERIHHALYLETREREGREASPTAAIIDS